jgi:predicted HTH domain antitoxin
VHTNGIFQKERIYNKNEGMLKTEGEKKMSERVMTELPDAIMKEIARWAEEEGMDKSMLLTKIIEEGIKAWKMNKALEMYKAQKVTLWRAAELAGVSLAEMLEELPRRKIVFQ